MSEALKTVEDTEKSVTTCEQSDVKRPTQTRLKLQPSSVMLDDVPKGKSGSVLGCVDGIRYRKRKKTRRGKSKRRRLKPYARIPWQDRYEQDDKDCSKRANNVRAKMFACGQPVAPYNTTQFLMDDHNDLQDLDVQLQAVTTNADGSNVPVLHRQTRARDSSFSVDSDEDFFYSSPEDEGDFLSKEFSSTYEDLHAERLNSMPKAQLIQEYLQLEEKVDMLEKRLKKSNTDTRNELQILDCDKQGESREDENDMNMDTSQKIYNLKQEVEKLYMENEKLRRENELLRCKEQSQASVSSVDSESDSTSTCSSDSGSGSGSGRGSTSGDGSSDGETVPTECDSSAVELRTSGTANEEMK